MDSAEVLRALEYVQRYFDKQDTDYMDEQLAIIRNHLTDPGYVRVPVEPTAAMADAFEHCRYLECLESASYWEAMIKAARETSND